MTTPPKNIMVKCPQCQRVYIDWFVPALGSSVSGSALAEQGPSTVCSKCGHRSQLEEMDEVKGVFEKK